MKKLKTKKEIENFSLLKYGWHPVDYSLIKKAWDNKFFTDKYKLTEEGEKFLKMYLADRSYTEIGQTFGFSRQNVGITLKRLEKLLKEIKGD